MALPGMMSSFARGSPACPRFISLSVFGMGPSSRSRSVRTAACQPAAGPFFARIACARPRPRFAPARLCAPDCAREPSAGRRSPARSVGVFFRAGARRETKRPPDAASSCFILSWFCEGSSPIVRHYFNFSMNKLLSSITDPILPFAKRFHSDGLIPAGHGLTPGAEPDERRPSCAISGTRHRNMS